jgi:hypothetical protein
MMALLALFAWSSAAQAETPAPTEEAALAEKKGQGGAKGEKGRKGKGRHKGPPPGDGEYEHETFATPSAGLVTWNDGTTTTSSLSIGGQAGVNYWEIGGPLPRYQGTTRAALSYILGTNTATNNSLSGWEARIGSFYGPRWRKAALQAGPDLFHSQYRYGKAQLDPTTGLALPVTAYAWQKPFSVYAGLEPAWYLTDQEGTDWSEAELPGIGDEFSYKLGASMQVKGFRAGVDAVWRQTPYGVQSGYGLSLGLNK